MTQPRENVGKQALFLRESTGLVREVGPLTALLMNLAFIAFPTGFLLLVSSTFNFPRGDPLIAIAVSAVLFIPLTVLLNRVGVTYYRTASDYVFVTRNLNPAVGFASIFMFTIDQMFFNAVLISLGLTSGLAPTLYAIGLSSNDKALITISESLMNNPTVIFTAGTIVFAALIIINALSVKAGKYLASSLSILGLLTFILTVALLRLDAPLITAAINRAAPAMQSQALEVAGSLPSHGALLDTVYLIPYLAYVFPFINFVLSIGGELRRGKTMPIAIYGAYAISAVLLLIGVWLTISAININYLNGLFAIYYGLAPSVTYPSTLPPPYPQALLILAVKNPVIQWLIAIGSFTWYVSLVSVLIIQIARYLLALSFDRVLPSALAYVNPITHTPIIAHATDFAVTILLMYLYDFSISPLLTATMDVSTLVTILMYFMVITLTATVLGVRSKSATTAALGAYTTGLFAWIVYQEVVNPLAYLFIPTINAYIVGFFAVLFITGLVIYYVARYYRLKVDNIDINLLFREIPPE